MLRYWLLILEWMSNIRYQGTLWEYSHIGTAILPRGITYNATWQSRWPKGCLCSDYSSTINPLIFVDFIRGVHVANIVWFNFNWRTHVSRVCTRGVVPTMLYKGRNWPCCKCTIMSMKWHNELETCILQTLENELLGPSNSAFFLKIYYVNVYGPYLDEMGPIKTLAPRRNPKKRSYTLSNPSF